MKRLTFSLFAMALLVSSTAFSGKPVEIALEAELANHIEPPMVIMEDKKASDGKFIWMEGPLNKGGGGEGWAEYIINIPAKGKYALWGRVIAPDGNSNSFWVIWPPADPPGDPQVKALLWTRWITSEGPDWHWDRVNHWLNAGTFDREWEFKEVGETTLRIAVRDDATKLDALFVTSNIEAVEEGEADVRLPTNEDRKIQEAGNGVWIASLRKTTLAYNIIIFLHPQC